jgi:hypothetical protein
MTTAGTATAPAEAEVTAKETEADAVTMDPAAEVLPRLLGVEVAAPA